MWDATLGALLREGRVCLYSLVFGKNIWLK